LLLLLHFWYLCAIHFTLVTYCSNVTR
jgi:hypothetical protein